MMPTDFDAAIAQYLRQDKTPPEGSNSPRLDPVRRVGKEERPSAHVQDAHRYLAMSLADFRHRGALLEIRVPWLTVTLWFVPDERDVATLFSEGITRGRIWTARELMQLMALSGHTADDLQTLTRAKLALSGEIEEVRRR